MQACQMGHVEVATALLDGGADMTMRDKVLYKVRPGRRVTEECTRGYLSVAASLVIDRSID